MLIGGDFTSVNGTGRNRIARLEELTPTGSVDEGFVADVTYGTPDTGVSVVHSLLAQPTSKQILVGGNFTHVKGVGRRHVARLTPTSVGTVVVDSQLRAGSGTGSNPSILGRGPDNAVRSFAIQAIQANNRIILGGDFTVYDVPGVSEDDIKRRRIVRLCGP